MQSTHAYLPLVRKPVRKIKTHPVQASSHLRPADNAQAEHKVGVMKRSLAVIDRQLLQVTNTLNNEYKAHAETKKASQKKFADEMKKRDKRLEKKLAYSKKRQENLTRQRTQLQAKIAHRIAQKNKQST